MKSTIRIPDKIKVGYQNRNGTYTGKLAYVIYYDNKGKLRKETSWNSWRSSDIEPNDYSNEPTSGFVLNKKAGGYSTGWNHRNTYVRVYDPRGFEFEISVPNLLFILENTSSIKGKGLEGKFVYGWDGKDLVLIPCDSPDYKSMSELNDKMKANNYTGKDMIVGGTYLTKDNKEVIYMGRFDYHGSYKRKKSYFFYDRNGSTWWNTEKHITSGSFHDVASVGGYIIDAVSDTCVSDYADIFDMFEYYEDYNPYDKSKDEYFNHTLESFEKYVNKMRRTWGANNEGKERSHSIYMGINNTDMEEYTYRHYWRGDSETKTRAITRSYYYEEDEFRIYSDDRGYRNNLYDKFSLYEFFNKFKPQWKKEYLADGKLRKVKYYESER